MPAKSPDSIQNRLLAALPSGELARLRPRLQPFDLALGQMLSEGEKALEHVYFPNTGMISLIRPMLDGATVEVGVVGREGFVGMGVVLGEDINILGKMVQSPGTGLRTPMATLRAELDQCPVLKKRLLSFVQALLSQIAQSTACNGRHRVQQRLARWLLMASDRIERDALALSHEFLSMMLGVRRPGVTVALGVFRKAGLLRYSHGRIEILDRRGLEAAACECYGDVRAEYERLLP
jgi:CRP-like cAMP-binding protein